MFTRKRDPSCERFFIGEIESKCTARESWMQMIPLNKQEKTTIQPANTQQIMVRTLTGQILLLNIETNDTVGKVIDLIKRHELPLLWEHNNDMPLEVIKECTCLVEPICELHSRKKKHRKRQNTDFRQFQKTFIPKHSHRDKGRKRW